MLDKLGRSIDYLRMSLTNECNMRCIYCRPDKGACEEKMIMPYEEIVLLLGLFVQNGIKKIRLTGGEPLLYPRIIELVEAIKDNFSIEKLVMTTNGILLSDKAAQLLENGLDGINISIDALTPKVFRQITRGSDIHKVLLGIEAVRKKIPVKINTVIMKGINEQEIIPLAEFSRQYDIPVRFIEMMPFSQTKNYEGIKENQIKDIISSKYGSLIADTTAAGVASYYDFGDKCGKIGFISALSHNFCHECNRIRLMSNGILKPCLYSEEEYDLKQLLLQRASAEEIKSIINKVIYNKPARHKMQERVFFNNKHKFMSEIGG